MSKLESLPPKNPLDELRERFAQSQLSGFFLGMVYVLAGSYLLANLITAWVGVQLVKTLVSPQPLARLNKDSGFNLTPSNANYFVLQKEILERNLFNLEGKYPSDDEEKKKDDSSGSATLDPNAPCPPSKLKVTLIGTIAMENPRESVATVREGSFDADVYRIGDRIIGHEEMQVYDIYPRRLVFKNGDGKFECIELKIDPKLLGDTSGPGMHISANVPVEETTKSILLDADWVKSEIGEGFSKIISSARMVPNADGLGFKVFDIRPGSLFSKAGLQEGDVITQVNSIALKPDQGFAVYQAFQDETNITLLIRAKGVTPKTLEIKIK